MKDSQSSKKKIKKFIKAKPARQSGNAQKPSKAQKPKDIFVDPKLKTTPTVTEIQQSTLTKQPPGLRLAERIALIKTKAGSFAQTLKTKLVLLAKYIKPIELSKLKYVRRHKNLRRIVKNNESDLQLVLFPMILLMVLVILNVINSQMFRVLEKEEFSASYIDTKVNPYPFVQQVKTPELSANAAIIVDANSQVILFSKNPELRFSMASTTKIMTALTGMDYYKLEDVLTVKSTGIEGSGLGLVPGDTFTFKDMLYAMMLPSANDAAQVIADNYPGGAEAFVLRMNEKAASLHLSKTHYADPAGLDDDGDYTTVVDLARLASYAINNKTFVEITSTRNKTITNSTFTRSYPLTNLNRLLGSEGVTGIKTGTTEGAGEVLVTSTVKNGHTYIIVVMQSKNRFADTQALMNFIDESVQYIIPSKEGYNLGIVNKE